jgi:putative PEP-CTERM system histidine kinase
MAGVFVNNLGVFSYGVAAVCWLLLFLLLLTSWRGRLQGGLIVTAVMISMLWALRAAHYASAEASGPDWWYQLLEISRGVLWLVFLVQLLEPSLRNTGIGRWLRWVWPTLVGYGVFLVGIEQSTRLSLPFNVPTDAATLGHIGLSIAGLALIEQLFRNTRPQRRWATKFLYLGLGVIFAYDFFLYADALLFKRLDPAVWEARGLVSAMAAPLIAVAASRNPEWSLDVFVSRRMVLHSAAIFGAGIYLLAMAGMGYYIRAYGGAWGTTLQLVFVTGAGVLLFVLLFSGQLRAKARVILSKHFFNYKYDYREEWLSFTHTLSSGQSNEPLRERAIRAAAEIVHSNGGLLWTRREPGDFTLAAAWNMNEPGVRSERGDSSLVRFLEQQQWIIELNQCERDAEMYGDLALPEWLQKLHRAWLVIPLLHGEELKGFLVLAEPRAVQELNWEDRDLLKTAGRQVASYVVLLETTEALWASRQFEAFHRLSAYVVHDLKNIAAQLALVVSNAARHKANPVFIADAFSTVANATERMNRLLTQLRKETRTDGSAQSVALVAAACQAVAARAARRPTPTPQIKPDDEPWVRVDQERLIAVLEHLIQNAQEATGEEGVVEVSVYSENQMAVVAIRDTGCGMDAKFIREQLFKPFTTTKGNAGMGIGVYESYEFTRAAGGELTVVSRPGQGSTFFLRLPRSENPGTADRGSEASEWNHAAESS